MAAPTWRFPQRPTRGKRHNAPVGEVHVPRFPFSVRTARNLPRCECWVSLRYPTLPTPRAYRTQYPGPGGAGFAAKLDLSQPAGVEVSCVANAASGWAGRNSLYATGAVAPGEVISIFGGT